MGLVFGQVSVSLSLLIYFCLSKMVNAMWAVERIKEWIGPLASGLYEVSEIVELLLSEAPRFVRSGVLTEEFLLSAFGSDRLPELGVFLSVDQLTISDLPGYYLVGRGEVLQTDPMAHGIFLGDVTVRLLSGKGSFFGNSAGKVFATGRGFAYEVSMVDAYDQSFVSYQDRARGLVTDSASAEGGGFSSLQVSQEGTLRVRDEAFFLARHKAMVEASGRSFGMCFDSSEIILREDTFVVPMDESVTIEASAGGHAAPLEEDMATWNALRHFGASFPSGPGRRREMEHLCHVNR